MNRVTALGVFLLRERRTSARGVPYALGWVAFRGMDRYARVPVVGHGVLADRLEAAHEASVVLSGFLRERTERTGETRLQVVAEEVFAVELPTFRAPLGHPAADGYARAEVAGLVALEPKPLRGAVGLRVAVRVPEGDGWGTSFVNAVVLGELPQGVGKGTRVYMAGALMPRREAPERLTLYASELRVGVRVPREAGEAELAAAF